MRKWFAVLSAAIVLVGGCSRNVEPEAVAEQTRWDPCSITPEAIAATGLDPAYRDEGWGEGIVVEDWERCAFRPPGSDVLYVFSVKSSLEYSLDDLRQDPRNFEDHDVVLGDREAYQYRTKVAESAVTCNVGVDLPPGVVVFMANFMGDMTAETDPCAIVFAHASDLVYALPAAAK
ncbi:DUF3558 family protein [Rhodococcoides kyotonense]|uniref:DUF3558 domain-containing protein n=1 Tax=Rhodococcoides kyotonense TaxID=398843 RepID=A0A239IP29_9NOCA|nr:DUF3558 family protein [Rhodococcus kyotonensis]SNS94823.1 Protein of unknown function [Rhodococcus kyotonensis]